MPTRRKYLKQLSAIGLMGSLAGWDFIGPGILSRAIPSTGELLPAIGLGTWRGFDVGESEQERTPMKNIIKTLYENGGRVIDSSPMYGQAENVVGETTTELKLNDSLFIATKVWTSGLENGKQQIEQSFQLLKRKKFDLLQIHNLTDWQTHLKTLQILKGEGRIRYIGLTHYIDGMHPIMADIIRKNKVDFVQVNYNIRSRNADRVLLPAAQDNGVAVIINPPFEEGALFQHVRGEKLPDWAVEFNCKSWAQFFLKFIISHLAVTCAIPGTSKADHMLDNITAGFGGLPNLLQREKMIRYFEGL